MSRASASTGENKLKTTGDEKTNENKPPKKTKVPNYCGKAQSKIKVGRSTVTDGNYWRRVIQEDLAKPEKERKAPLASIKFETKR